MALQAKEFSLAGWRVVLADLGISPSNVLRRAGLPDDLLSRDDARLGTAAYFGLWRALQDEAADPHLPLRIGEALSVEAFDPPVFAALCSPNLGAALQRLRRYKRLIAPMALDVDAGTRTTVVELRWLNATTEPPPSLVAVELIFLVRLARLATRTRVCPVIVSTPHELAPTDAYAAYFGVPVEQGPTHRLAFSAADIGRPFLTANDGMWSFFQPELRRRLAQLDAEATMTERARAALLELLPGGLASADAVAKKLGVSKRTLQRKLQAEDSRFQTLVDDTREQLARHYLRSSTLSSAEISFLLGFEDPNSFFRAFHRWTGKTPEQARASMR